MTFHILAPAFTQTDYDTLQKSVSGSLRLQNGLGLWRELAALARSTNPADVYKHAVTPCEVAFLSDSLCASLDSVAPFGFKRGHKYPRAQASTPQVTMLYGHITAVISTLAGRSLNMDVGTLHLRNVKKGRAQRGIATTSLHADLEADENWFDKDLAAKGQVVGQWMSGFLNGNNGHLRTIVIPDAVPRVYEVTRTMMERHWLSMPANDYNQLFLQQLGPIAAPRQLLPYSLAFDVNPVSAHCGVANDTDTPLSRELGRFTFGAASHKLFVPGLRTRVSSSSPLR